MRNIIETIVFIVVSYVIGIWVGCYYSEKIANKMADQSYLRGFHRGVECRGMMSAPACDIVLEQSNEL